MLAIILEGGSVADVVTDDPKTFNQPFMVIDYDVDEEDSSNPDLALVPQSDGRAELAHMKQGLVDKAEINLHAAHRLTARDVRRLVEVMA